MCALFNSLDGFKPLFKIAPKIKLIMITGVFLLYKTSQMYKTYSLFNEF